MTFGTFLVRSIQAGAITAVDARSDRSFARHLHDEYGVGLLTSGAQRSWSGRGPVEAISGNVTTVNPAELHDGAPIGSHRSWSMLYFSQNLVRTLMADLEEGRCSVRELHAPVVDDPKVARMFANVRTAAMHPEGEPALEERLLTLFGRLFEVVQRPTNLPARQLSKVQERIDDAPEKDHPLTELAALAGLSRYQTLRGFARMTGLTPHAYVIQRRLDLAVQTIRREASLAGAAAGAGFADQSHMHRLFVARHGFTPGAYAAALNRAGATTYKNDTARSL